jgi:hypothetical protein
MARVAAGAFGFLDLDPGSRWTGAVGRGLNLAAYA